MRRRRRFPILGQRFNHHPLPRFFVWRFILLVKIRRDDLEESERALPMARLVRDIKLGDGVGADTFTLHFIH